MKYLTKHRDIYELDALQPVATEDDTSFIATYARGDWDPSVIPEIPLGLHAALGLKLNGTGSQGSPTAPDGSRLSPPDILESVEAVYRSYLETTTTYTQPTPESTPEEPAPVPEALPGLIEHGIISQRRSSDRNSTTSGSSSEKLCSPSVMSHAALRRFQKVSIDRGVFTVQLRARLDSWNHPCRRTSSGDGLRSTGESFFSRLLPANLA